MIPIACKIANFSYTCILCIQTLSLVTLQTSFGAVLVSASSGEEHLVVNPEADPEPDPDLSQLISWPCCLSFTDRSLVVF